MIAQVYLSILKKKLGLYLKKKYPPLIYIRIYVILLFWHHCRQIIFIQRYTLSNTLIAWYRVVTYASLRNMLYFSTWKKNIGGRPLQLFALLSVKSLKNTFKNVFWLLIELQYVYIYQKMQNFMEKKYGINDFFPKMSIF